MFQKHNLANCQQLVSLLREGRCRCSCWLNRSPEFEFRLSTEWKVGWGIDANWIETAGYVQSQMQKPTSQTKWSRTRCCIVKQSPPLLCLVTILRIESGRKVLTGHTKRNKNGNVAVTISFAYVSYSGQASIHRHWREQLLYLYANRWTQ